MNVLPSLLLGCLLLRAPDYLNIFDVIDLRVQTTEQLLDLFFPLSTPLFPVEYHPLFVKPRSRSGVEDHPIMVVVA
jgi:hypothetical protein